MLKPVLVIAMIFRTIDSLRMFDLVYVLTGGGPGGSTRTLSYLGFEAFANDSFGLGSTVSVITFLISLAITLIYLRAGKFSEQLK
jgi:multiple sugar transport system permease protein